jgi:hypothetical protein
MASVHVRTINNPICRYPRLCFAPYDRRQYHRFPIIAQAEYILDGHRANARTVDISRGGVLLNTRSFLQIGQPILVLLDWPVLLDQRCRLRLGVSGTVLRSNAAGTAVGISGYEFRIRGQNRTRLPA